MEQPTYPDYRTLKALADRSGLHLIVVYRLTQGERVKDADAWQRLLKARIELQREGKLR